MPYYQISVDGYAACGKSTLARGLADKLGFLYIDSGAMYRGVTLYFLENNIPFDRSPSPADLRDIVIEFEYLPHQADRLLLNGTDVTSRLRSAPVNDHVSLVAAMSTVRQRLVAIQQSYGATHNLVMDGRDIGTVVFPHAILKIFLTASLETRIHRRMMDIKSAGHHQDYELVRRNLIERDHIDSTREDSPLKQAGDAVLIDNTNLTIDEQLAMTQVLAQMRINKTA
ncbi:MAG TPA: (d)CMP kinase [Membranihabitans sp.]|nr:(d)CMP kinase [Membranihabitans sp.]